MARDYGPAAAPANLRHVTYVLRGDGDRSGVISSAIRFRGRKLKSRQTHSKVQVRSAQAIWRRWVAIFAILAFAAQVQLTQTHIHNPNIVSAIDELASGFIAKPAKNGVPGKTTPFNDPANCPICQAFAHSGQFVTPSAIALALPNFAIALVPLAIATPAARDSVSHSWQGRAPPRH